jgi:hypothetical protein
MAYANQVRVSVSRRSRRVFGHICCPPSSRDLNSIHRLDLGAVLLDNEYMGLHRFRQLNRRSLRHDQNGGSAPCDETSRGDRQQSDQHLWHMFP